MGVRNGLRAGGIIATLGCSMGELRNEGEMKMKRILSLAALMACVCGSAAGQIRVVAWNISNYAGGRDADIKNCVYGSFEGRSMSPDVIAALEFTSQAATDSMRNILNSAPGSPGDWASAPFIDGVDTDASFFYRTSKVKYLGTTIVAVGSSASTNQPRNTYRYDFQPVGYNAASTVTGYYACHMKSGSASSDISRRQVECANIKNDVVNVIQPRGWNYIVGGDFNMQSSNQQPYQTLMTVFVDPIKTPGSWNNNAAFHIVHTQDPSGPGGMDDRLDFLLVSPSLVDGHGVDYIGNANVPYSTTTWDDPNHSYRSWGNDGTSFNLSLTTTGNAMVGASIAQSLINVATAAGGHLPVFMDVRVPAKVAADETVIDFGTVNQGDVASLPLTVSNGGNVALWTVNGLETLTYSVAGSTGFAVTGGGTSAAPGAPGNVHTVTMDTSSVGNFTGTVTIASNDVDVPSLVVTVKGTVQANCAADFNGDGFVDFFDFSDFINCFEQVSCPDGKTADFNNDDFVDFFDFSDFIDAFEAGC